MKIINVTIIAIFVSLIISCGSKSENKDEDLQGVIPEHQLKALEQAQGVEQMLDDAAEDRKKAMAEQGL